jgi:hypothetical protein
VKAVLLAILCALLLPSAAMADQVGDAYLRQLDLIQQEVVTLAEAMPADRYGFRPTNGEFKDVRTFGEQVKHVSTMIYMTAAIVLQERSPYGPGTNDNGPDEITGKDRIVEYLKASLVYAKKAMGSLTEKNHLDPIKTYFGSQLRVEIAEGIMYHSFNHYGQMVVYARMNGIVPPATK